MNRRTDTMPIPVIEAAYTCAWCTQGIAGRPVLINNQTYHAYAGDVDCARAATLVAASGGTS